jgi:hypothetical protein
MGPATSMDRAAQVAAEADVLRALCDALSFIALRADLCRSLTNYKFADAEHQVVFESIRALIERGQFTADQLAVNLVNRGFPDTDMKKYFVSDPPTYEKALAQIGQLITSSTRSASEH